MTDPEARPPAEPDVASRLACIELVELATPYLEGELPADEHARVDRHLAACDGCWTYVDQVRETIAIAGGLTPEAVPGEAVERLLAAFRAARRA